MYTLVPATHREFIDREELLEDMLFSLRDPESTIGFALYGNRRVGKTSILREVQRLLSKEEGIVCVYFSMWDLVEPAVEEFARNMAASILEAYSGKLPLRFRIKDLIKAPLTLFRELIKETGVGLKLQDDVELLLKIDKNFQTPVDEVIERVFNLPEELAKITETKCVLMIDEFPSVIDLKNGPRIGEALVRKIRTIHETQRHVALCVSGSIKKTMEISVLSSASAFYHQLIVKEVKPFKPKDLKKLIEELGGCRISTEGAETLARRTRGVPFYAQFLGREMARKGIKEIDKKDIEATYEEFLQEEGNVLFASEFERMAPKERRVVALMVREDVSTPARIAETMNESINYVSRYLVNLMDKGIIRRESKGRYGFEDGVFEDWLRSKFAE